MVACCSNFYELPIARLLLGEFFHPGGERLTRQLAASAVLGPGDHVLDVASGHGASARLLADYHGCRVSALDISIKNLGASTATGIQSIQGNACALPWRQAAFDAVISECSLCLCDAPAAALSEMARVVKPGGRIAITDLFVNAPVPEILMSPLGEALCIQHAQPQSVYAQWLREAGLAQWRFNDVTWALVEMVQSIREKLKRLQSRDAAILQQIPLQFGDASAALAAAASFLASGGAGYGMWVGRSAGSSAGSVLQM